MLGVVMQIDGYDPVDGVPVSLAAGSRDHPDVCHLNGGQWWPTIAKLPTLRYDLFDGSFGGQITAPSSSMTMSVEPWPAFGRYALADARFRLWTGEVGAPWGAWTLRFDGRLTGQPTLQDGIAQIDFAADDAWLDNPLLATYAGTGGAEGPEGLKGQTKPLSIGSPRYAAGKLVDSINSVFQVSSYGAVQNFEVALERLARFGAPVSDYPTYDALVAAPIPVGRWAVANPVGMARFGAPPTGQISFLLNGDQGGPNGWVRRPGQIIRRIALLSGGAGRIDDASLNALDAARPYNLSLQIEEQTTARDLIQKIAASVNAVAGVSWLGQLFVAPVGLGAPTVTLAADGSALPPVSSVKQISIAAPWKKLTIGAERAWTVHALSDIAFTAPLVPLGDYSAATTYREGNIVQYQDASWLYVNPTATAGNAPPAPAFWRVAARGSKGIDGSSGNQVVLSSFAQDLRGFRPGAFSRTATPAGGNSAAAAFTTGINLPSFSGQRKVPYAVFSGTMAAGDYLECFWTPSPWAGDSFASGQGYMMAVGEGDRVYANCLAAQHRCVMAMYMLIFDASGNFLTAPEWRGARENGALGGDPDNFNRIGGIYTVAHPQAAFAALLFRMIGTGGSEPYIFFTDPAMGLLPPDQDTVPAYSPGPPDPLADITALSQIVVGEIPEIILPASSTGVVTAGALPVALLAQVTRGGASIRTSPSTSYALANVSGSLSGASGDLSIDTSNTPSKGTINLSRVGGSGGADLIVTVSGQAQPPKRITVTVQRAAATPGGGGATPGGGYAGDVSGKTISSTTYVEAVIVADVVVAAGKTIVGTLSAEYDVGGSASGAQAMVAKFQYLASGATAWTDFAAAVTGEPARNNGPGEGKDPGSIYVGQSSAPAAGTYHVRVLWAIQAGTRDIYTTSGNVTIGVS